MLASGKTGLVTKNRWSKILRKQRLAIETKTDKRSYELKARILGFLAGDGSLFVHLDNSKKKTIKNYNIKFYPDNLEMANSFVFAFDFLYGCSLPIRKAQDGNYFVVRTKYGVAFEDLERIVSLGTYNWKVPFSFLKTRKMKIEWLRAFFDCEAHVGKNKIQVQSVNFNGLSEIKKLLFGVGIDSSKIYKYERKQANWSTNYLIELRGKQLAKYYYTISFNHSNKRNKLLSLVS